MKLREYANYLQQNSQESTKLEFSEMDLDNIIAIMQTCDVNDVKAKFFTALNKLALLLLMPPKPFVNSTISTNDYVSKLLNSSDEQNKLPYLLFSSLIASTNDTAIDILLEKGKIEWTLEQLQQKKDQSLNDTHSYILTQIIYNCTKQEKVRTKYRSSLTFDLYELLKSSESKESRVSLLRNTLSAKNIEIIVQSIKDLVIGGEQEEEKLSNLLKDDINEASSKSDVEFINKVIVPVLHAEDNIPVDISLFDINKPSAGVQPIFSGNEGESKGVQFFLKTEILNDR